MDDPKSNGLENSAPERHSSPQEDAPDSPPPFPAAPAFEENRDVYPLRPPEEDPRWAVRTVKIWFGVALAFLAFILALMLLGVFYD